MSDPTEPTDPTDPVPAAIAAHAMTEARRHEQAIQEKEALANATATTDNPSEGW